jgi:hypothetical protein
MFSARAFFVCLIFCTLTGCGRGLASVDGVVSLDGQPIAGSQQVSGTVRFYREDGGGAPAVGRIDGSGKYVLKTGGRDGAEPGAYVVAIAVKRMKPPETPGGMPRADLVTPKRYASVTESGLHEIVEPGSNTFNFELSSK